MVNEDTKQKYVNFYTDFAFKKLFGTEINKDLLKGFLNALLMGQETITEINYLNPEKFGEYESSRKAIFDVYCKNEKGHWFIVEMQKAEQRFFKDRSVYYSTFPITDQAPRGDWNFELKSVYTIGILNFTFNDMDSDYYHHEVKLMDTRTKEVFYDKLTYIYLEMPKFNKTERELVTLFDKWLYAIKHMSDLTARPEVLEEDIFKHLFEAAEINRMTPEEKASYRESLKDYWDWYSITTTADEKGFVRGREVGLEEGLAKGRKEGLAKGREEGLAKGADIKARQVAEKLKSMGLSSSDICAATGLSAEEIDGM